MKYILLVCLCMNVEMGVAQLSSIRPKIEAIAKKSDGKLGVAVLDLATRDSLTLYNHIKFPMQSVYKYHLAVAVLSEVDKGKWGLNQKIEVKKQDLLPNTHSPMRDKYPNGNVKLPLSEIIKFAVSDSDNSACDMLFRLMGGPEKVNAYMQSIGMKAINIATNEETMHHDPQAQFKNWSTPWGAVELLDKFYNGKLLSKNNYNFLWNAMINTTTGPNKIKGLLPKKAIVAHKTGYSGKNDKGIIMATNDIGIVKVPNGKTFIIATFLSNTTQSVENSERLIAEVAKVCYDYFEKTP